ncbi:MAG TPA: cysteine--tRNA ligase [Ktedonobacterales bacterium]|nr:cysteine--tRNA ligase [Ktedonobacterales bacterium]
MMDPTPQDEIPRTGSSANERGGTPLHLFNTMSRAVERIVPLEAGRLRMYSCGPTVYRFIHVGNLRTFTMADWIRRALTAQGIEVMQIKNITDVGHMRQEALDRGEDKLVVQARREGKTPWDIAAFYTDAFHTDEQKLNILPAHVFPRATDHIPEMIAMVQRLLDNGSAYEAGGNVFFSVKDFPGYGQLSGNLLEYLGQGQHTANEVDANKRAPEDFPLWKVAEEGRIMAWDSPWGRGFPGWHIECSAMSAKYLGPQFDLHTGGVDNIFPHHEDERAQSEAASGQRFVSYWVHGQHLLADGLKMAKSTGNAYTLADVEARGFEPLALRYFFTMAKYRSRINFTFRALRAAQVSLNRLRELVYRLADRPSPPARADGENGAGAARQAFWAAVNDDLNMPRAMAVVWGMARDESITPRDRLALLYEFDTILGFDLAAAVARRAERQRQWRDSGEQIVTLENDVSAPVMLLARERLALRQRRAFDAADALRARIHAAGYEVRDATPGVRLVRRAGDEVLISGSGDVPSRLEAPDRYAFSVNLLAHNSGADLERCVASVARHAGGRDIELVILDNGSTDDTLAYLKRLDADGAVNGLPVRVLFADHDMGFAAGRNAQFRASLGRIVVQIDTSIALSGDIWTPIEALLERPDIGLVGPYGLVTDDLREFRESVGPDVDAIEGYLMAFRRTTLREVGPADEKFRFYRLMDIDYSFEFKKAGFRAVVSPEVAARVIKHPHREWYALSEEEQATKSKKNFDIFRRRRHHCESLLVRYFVPGQAAPWGHDHETPEDIVDPRFEHTAYTGAGPHSHEHKHWPDHSHTHAHVHLPAPRWHDPATPAVYQPSFDPTASEQLSTNFPLAPQTSQHER